ncbi:helix-turn-helix domain-containing protein [Embleya sp. NPDC050493]|uniref:helix-turn-helix domain-containing protein n=1 Tax=Embleya sp. NPDC050493 TaxID=3363989 RepID=UPI00378BA5FA
MAPGFDHRHRPVRPAELLALIHAVRDGVVEESTWLEWKSTLDLTAKRDLSHIARAVLAFANRMPDDADLFVEGHGYLLVGVDKGVVQGVAWRDPIDLSRGVEAYTGDCLRWFPAYLKVDCPDGEQREVLVIDVEPPRWGDPIHVARKESEHFKDGAVLVRNMGNSAPAKSRQVDALSQRMLRSRDSLCLDVEVASGIPIPVIGVVREDLEATVEREKRSVLESLLEWEARNRAARPRDGGFDAADFADGPEADSGVRTYTSNPPVLSFSEYQELAKRRAEGEELDDTERHMLRAFEARTQATLGMAFAGLASLVNTVPDGRSPEQYRAEVDRYIAAYGQTLGRDAHERAVRSVAPLRLRLCNPTDTNLAQVEIQLYVPGDVTAVQPPASATFDPGYPDRPTPYGPRPRSPLGFEFPMPSFALAPRVTSAQNILGPSHRPARRPVIRNGGSTTIDFPPVDLRPHSQIDLDPIVLLVRTPAPSTVVGTWQATCTNKDGRTAGTLTLTTGTTITLAELLDEPDAPVH